jgi:hypothetical protein
MLDRGREDVVRYYEDGPTYATMTRRIGACSTDQAARRAGGRPRGGEVGSRGGQGLPGVGPLLAVTPLGWLPGHCRFLDRSLNKLPPWPCLMLGYLWHNPRMIKPIRHSSTHECRGHTSVSEFATSEKMLAKSIRTATRFLPSCF